MHTTHRRIAHVPALLALLVAAAIAPASAAQTQLRQFTDKSPPSFISDLLLGGAVAAIGDLDGDGCTDFALGGRGLYPVTSTDCLVLSGRTFTALGQLVPPVLADLSQFGFALDGAGDIDGDGVPDILAGAPGGVFCSILFGCSGSTRGVASVQSGATLTALATWTGDAEGDCFGFSVASVGDVDGDSVPDLVVGAPQRAPWQADAGGAGYVRLLSGASGAELHTWTGAAPGDGFGWFVAGPGDVDGDGIPDVLIGAPFAAGTGGVAGAGWAGLFRGSDGAFLRSWSGEQEGDDFGHVARAGDVDADGLADVLIGAPGFDGPAGLDAGVARVYSGVTGAVLLDLDGPTASIRLGASVCGVGDVTGDGHADVLVGSSPAPFPPQKSCARLYSGLVGRVIYHIDHVPALGNNTFLSELGGVVAAGGDVNGDGQLDFILASPTLVVVGGDVIHNYGGRHVLAFSGLPLAVTSLPNAGTPGAAGVPELNGDGSTEANQLLTLDLAHAAPAAPVLFALGTEIKSTPLNGITLWPSPPLMVPAGATDIQGALELSGRWPSAIGFGTPLFVQAIVLDSSAPTGLAASNTLQLTAQ